MMCVGGFHVHEAHKKKDHTYQHEQTAPRHAERCTVCTSSSMPDLGCHGIWEKISKLIW